MRITSARLFVCSLCLVIALTASLLFTSEGRSASTADEGRLVVHEWGTFTNFSGSDGVKLDFRPLVENDLPAFVLDRAWQAGALNLFSKLAIVGRQRMETPVTYFYTDTVRDVNVRVGFPEGLLTEFYPPVKEMLPAFDMTQFGMLPPLGDSALDWGRITLIPESQLATSLPASALADRVNSEIRSRLVPDSSDCPHYAHARETDSAIVHLQNPADPKRPRMPSGNFFEKFLFYRGVGNFTLPLQLKSLGSDAFELTNHGSDEVRSLFLVTVHNEQMRFRTWSSVQPDETLSLSQAPDVSSIDSLCDKVADALQKEGLYEKEAWAMVNTWRDSWFGEEGTRLFYVVPHRITEELLPLEVTPAPDELVRVLVGRMEIMSPEHETQILQLVKDSRQARTRHYEEMAQRKAENRPEKPYHIPRGIIELGRLAEPALVRVISTSKDYNIRAEGRALLKQWRQSLGLQGQTASLP